jgi:hypothetical protein
MIGSVQLIVTGHMEEIALADALKKAFPSLSFSRTIRLDGITSVNFALAPHSPAISQLADKLASALVAAVDPGRKGTPEDMAIVIDDLELANLNQPEVVVKYFRNAVIRCVQNRWTNQKRQELCFDRVRERCSFHLFVPMAEAYFFGEVPDALVRAGATLTSTVSGKDMDVENFLVTNDTNYLTAPKGTSFWAKNQTDRAQHPKRYLDYLCCPDINTNKKARYRETHGGIKALKTLNWDSVLLGNSPSGAYLRALFDDISWRFNLPNPYPGFCAPITTYKIEQDNILRNL